MLQVVKGMESVLLPRLRFLSCRNNSERKSVEDAVFLFFLDLRTEEILMKRSCFFIFRSRVLFCDCFTFSVGASGPRQQLCKTPDSCLQTMCRLASQQRSEPRHKQSSSPARRSFVFSFFHHSPCFRVPRPSCKSMHTFLSRLSAR